MNLLRSENNIFLKTNFPLCIFGLGKVCRNKEKGISIVNEQLGFLCIVIDSKSIVQNSLSISIFSTHYAFIRYCN